VVNVSAIDTSYWNGHPDFAQVAASGVTLVIPKAVDVERGYPVVDSCYYANRAAIRAAGLRCGSYLFNGPDSPMAAADYYLSVIDWRPGEVAAIDVENALGVTRWNPAQVLEFCSELIRSGIPAGDILVYMSSSVTRAYDWSPVVGLGVSLWVAQYNANDGTVGAPPSFAGWGSYALWQHTSVATVPGISGHVDMNVIGTMTASLNSTLIPQEIPSGDDSMRIIHSTTGDNAGAIALVTESAGAHAYVGSELTIAQAHAKVFNPTGALIDVTREEYLVLVDASNARKTLVTVVAPLDSAALAAAIAAHLPAGATVDVTAIAAAVDAGLADNFAAIPGAVRNAIVK
jgi:GH25 family lysozyme M1 (1,4-beta-N-acetylmuramidase)